MIGKTIAGRYRIIEKISEGGLTTVYKALDTRFNRAVVIKVLPPHLARDVEFERRFRREVGTLARLDHPNIVQMYDYGESESLTYLAMEYVDGGSLADILSEGKPLDVDYAIEILRQIGGALSYAHRMGIIHQDIKPSNILISRDGRVLVSDFGLAKAAGALSLTEIGTILGTPEYMSPEQAMGKPVDARSDIYSLGVVLYEMLTGHPPFSGNTPWEFLHKHIYEPPPSLRQSNPAVSPTLDKAVLRALAKDPNDRYQTIDEFMLALVTPSQAPAVDIPVPELLSLPKPSRVTQPRAGIERMWRWALILVGIAALIVFGPAFWHWMRNQPVLAAWVLGTLLVLSLGLIARSLLRRAPPTLVPPPPRPFKGAARPTIQPRSAEPWLSTGETIPYTEPPAASTMMLRREPSAMAWLLVLNGPHRGRQFRLADDVTIGRVVDCDVALDDHTVSRQHARMRLQNDRFYVYDLGSSNGTFVNGVQVMRQELQDRDEIRIGDTIILFVQAVSPEDLTVDAKRRLREFDSVWEELTRSVRHD